MAWLAGQNFGFEIDGPDRAEVARRMMEWEALHQASRTRPCTRDALHLSLSWHPDERPSRPDMEAAARSALQALGLGTARAVFVAHNDTTHAHLHIVASRINPETGKAFPDRDDYLALSRWAKAWEIAHGPVRCHGRLTAPELAAQWHAAPALVLELLTKNQATFSRAALLRTLARAIPGAAARAAFADRLLTRADVIGLRESGDAPVSCYTTRQVLAAEQALAADAAALAAAQGHTADPAAAAAALDAHPFLSAEQRVAFAALTGRAGFALLAGEAGTGKSATLAAVRAAYEGSGRRVVGLAWTNAVAQDMRRDGFGTARTVAAELLRLQKGTTAWDANTVLVVDEAAMLATAPLAQLAAAARAAGAKLILAGDDRQLGSIERGGMFGPLRAAHGAAELHEVRRVADPRQKQAFNLMHKGDFAGALRLFAARGALHWSDRQDEAQAALVARYMADVAAAPAKARFVFAYTNKDVDALNQAIRAARKARGELGADHWLATANGELAFAVGDRIQFTGSASRKGARDAGLVTGNVGTILALDGSRVTVALDGKAGAAVREVTFTVGADAKTGAFRSFRHGYAGTIYRGQGRTLDQSYLYHSPHWRAASAYVALSRHREAVAVFVAKDALRGLQPWMAKAGGYDALTAALQAQAARSYAAWAEAKPALAAKYDLAAYVAYVQEQWAKEDHGADDLAALARHMGRADTKRAASSYQAAAPDRGQGADTAGPVQNNPGRPRLAAPPDPPLPSGLRGVPVPGPSAPGIVPGNAAPPLPPGPDRGEPEKSRGPLAGLLAACRAAARTLAGRSPRDGKPFPRRRRGGTAGGGFASLARGLARRFNVRKSFRQAAQKIGRWRAAPVPPDASDEEKAFLSDTLDWLILWDANAASDGQIEENFDVVSDRISLSP
ncbi:AAA family ATPase [Rhodovastum atsumiense]|uniref:AAA family ATPase n=1 Tax=Rhodovastum atsumiense TaxID=504468 RepID=UPI00139F2CB1|nr:AAA family ATPase [Rhodovastum atsumiense]